MKTPSMSKVEMTELVLPHHTNGLGTIFGGVILSWVDIAASICASRHCGRVAVTASFDTMNFLAPIHLGDVVTIRAKLNYVGGSSCEVGVDVRSENLKNQSSRHTGSAFVTMVSLGSDSKPISMPPLTLETDLERETFAAAELRRKHRLEARKAFKARGDQQ